MRQADIAIIIGGRELPPGAGSLCLEVCLCADGAGGLRLAASGDRPWGDGARPGAEVVLRLNGAERFRGPIARTTSALDQRERPWSGLVAEPEWLRRARVLGPLDTFHGVTDADAAARIADALGLEARIESTAEVHPVLEPGADPIAFLRARARAAGVVVAVAGGRLHFARTLPAGTPLVEIGPASEVLALRTSQWDLGRSGAVILEGNAGICPLDRIRLTGWEGAPAGILRVVRVRIAADPRGLRMGIFWVDEGVDLSRAALEEGEARALLAPGPGPVPGLDVDPWTGAAQGVPDPSGPWSLPSPFEEVLP